MWEPKKTSMEKNCNPIDENIQKVFYDSVIYPITIFGYFWLFNPNPGTMLRVSWETQFNQPRQLSNIALNSKLVEKKEGPE